MSNTTLSAITSLEELDQYRAQIVAQLVTKKTERQQLLEQVVETLEPLLEGARVLRETALVQELTANITDARAELEQITAAELAKLTAAVRPALTDTAPPSAAPLTRVFAPPLASPTPPPTPVPVPSVPSAISNQDPVSARVSSRGTGGPVVVRAATPSRSWKPRPVPEIDAEVAELERLLEAESGEGPQGLLRLKSLACRQRRGYWELEAQSAYEGQARALYGALKGKILAVHGERRVLPLNTNVAPPQPEDWEDLAQRYEDFGIALEIFDWYQKNAASLGPATAKELLEGIGATQQLLFRVIANTFHDSDDQQKGLYEALLEAGSNQQIYLDTLNFRRTDEELTRAAGALTKTFQRLRESVDRKERQQQCLERALEMATRSDFGGRPEDPDRLREVVLASLNAGVPASHRQLRDVLMPWFAYLLEEPRLSPIVREIEKELDRRMIQEPLQETGDEEEDGALSEEVQGLLQELLPYTRGKKCFFIGGDCREEKRRELEKILELDELIWPGARRTNSVYDFEADISRSDIVVLLIRFMRTGFKQAIELCDKYGARMVRMPRGLGVTRVIKDLHDQIGPRAGEPAGVA